MHHSMYSLSQVMLFFNWLRFPSGCQSLAQISSYGTDFLCNLSRGLSDMRLSPLLCHAANQLWQWEAFFIILLYPHQHFHVVFLTLCLQFLLPSARAEFMCIFEREQECFCSSFICFYCAHFLQSWIYRRTGSCQKLALHTMEPEAWYVCVCV